jgi:hypothetical protein
MLCHLLALVLSVVHADNVLPSNYWLSRRASLIESVWGYGSALPSKHTPDSIKPTNVTGVTEVMWDLGKPGADAPSIKSYVYQVSRSPGKRAPRAFLLHHGHSNAPEANGTWFDHYNMSGLLGEMADADVFILSMPLYGCNSIPGVHRHSWFQQFEKPGGVCDTNLSLHTSNLSLVVS